MTMLGISTIRSQSKGRHGFTMIEAALVLFLFSVIALTFYQLFALGSKRILDVRRKLGATALASERMEMIRSLPYASIGTKQSDGAGGWTYGIPPGDIIEMETVSESGATFTVHTTAQYVDDSFDGTASGGTSDTIPTDYKRVRLEISWDGAEGDQRVVTWGTFSPDGVEQPSNTGVLSVNVLDALGNGVQGAVIHIVNTANDVNLSAETDAFGNQSWPGALPGSGYSISVSKDGYYGVQTYPPYPDSAFNPLDMPLSVVVGSVNQKTFVFDHLSAFTVKSEDAFGGSIPNVSFSLAGGHQVGTVPASSSAVPVYGFSVSASTGLGGEKGYSDQSYGRYAFSNIGSVDGYRFLHVDPGASDLEGVFDLQPGESKTEKLIFANTSVVSLLVSVTRQEDVSGTPVDKPVSGASVHLVNASAGYDATVTTGISGQAYFPTTMPALTAGTYQYEVTMAGYGTATGSVDVTSGGGLQDKAVTLTLE
ncbi:MAG: carboxypeptidase regulatory-like domain-containing protein [Candidatus Moranbacteria bacterium]|nr:carboxypeptidase regulatory-like domain-containing protein [Candidatus Moranbacteria bacterium]